MRMDEQPIVDENDAKTEDDQIEAEATTLDEDATRPMDVIIDEIEGIEDIEQAPDNDGSPQDTENTMIATLKQEAELNHDRWQRAKAEFQNYKRRTEREKADTLRKITSDVLIKILPIIDDFELASANIPEEIEDNAWVSGTMLIQGKFQKLLETYNIEVIDPVGEEFDPNFMQAIGMDDDTEMDSGHVTVTLQKGYRSADTILRPALVRIAN